MRLKILETIGRQTDIMMAVGIIGLVATMLIPLPPLVLDVLLTINIGLSLAMLLLSMYVTEPLQFSVFPSLLLVVTLYRLALNISSTRLILRHAYAGNVIQAFGNFVVGGDFVVGMIVFLILVVIQFVVITTGSQRVAEVAARFTLDEMPGKQMAIDADLNAGLITGDEAKQRRRTIEREADFYGAMDGATKFVRGDAIACLIIVAVNITGGLIIGVLRLNLPIGEALQRYALLTVGDGLVSQMPALLVSTATGLIVTRAASESHLGADVASQMTAQPNVLFIVATMLIALGLVPGLPKISFFTIGGIAGLIGYYLLQAAKKEQVAAEPEPPLQAPTAYEQVPPLDRITVELGYNLVALADPEQDGDLPQRVTGVRKQVTETLGLVLPPIRIRDNILLEPNQYTIEFRATQVGRGQVYPELLMAMQPHPEASPIEGIQATEPVFGLPVWWIKPHVREVAEARRYTVIAPTTAIATHLHELLKEQAAVLLTRQDVQDMIESLRQTEPAVVNELLPETTTVGEIQQVLRRLLAEQIPIRDLSAILEALADGLRLTNNLDDATEVVRLALDRTICQQYKDAQDRLHVMTVTPQLEKQIQDSVIETPQGMVCAIEPQLLQNILERLRDGIQHIMAQGYEPVVLTSPRVRRHFRSMVAKSFPNLGILSQAEIPPGLEVQSATQLAA